VLGALLVIVPALLAIACAFVVLTRRGSRVVTTAAAAVSGS
jgi:hypothetical protein